MKKNNNKGFTLAELLIVVAIIAVLVAIAIPVFTSQLEKSRDATSMSNIRSAYAEAQASYLAEVTSDPNVTIHKDGGKIDYIEVKNVKFQGVQEGWNDLEKELPANCDWDALTAAMGGAAGSYTLKFTYNADGTIELTSATKATA